MRKNLGKKLCYVKAEAAEFANQLVVVFSVPVTFNQLSAERNCTGECQFDRSDRGNKSPPGCREQGPGCYQVESFTNT